MNTLETDGNSGNQLWNSRNLDEKENCIRNREIWLQKKIALKIQINTFEKDRKSGNEIWNSRNSN